MHLELLGLVRLAGRHGLRLAVLALLHLLGVLLVLAVLRGDAEARAQRRLAVPVDPVARAVRVAVAEVAREEAPGPELELVLALVQPRLAVLAAGLAMPAALQVHEDLGRRDGGVVEGPHVLRGPRRALRVPPRGDEHGADAREVEGGVVPAVREDGRGDVVLALGHADHLGEAPRPHGVPHDADAFEVGHGAEGARVVHGPPQREAYVAVLLAKLLVPHPALVAGGGRDDHDQALLRHGLQPRVVIGGQARGPGLEQDHGEASLCLPRVEDPGRRAA
mmetsp:Transcript_127098/g.359733  ORF Transcript_127098/g.359733 Transcript_127098/m.359733 type:complete len:278 (-) Transcript_127098:216-1049(-)